MVSRSEDPLPPIKIKVKSGDTLTGIAKKHGVTLDSILQANPQIKDPNKIKVGQKVTISTDRQDQGRVYKGWERKHPKTGKTMGESVRAGKNPYKALPSQKKRGKKLPAIAGESKGGAIKRKKGGVSFKGVF